MSETTVAHELEAAAQAAQAGGVIAYPTEAVWGLGVDPANSQAIERLLALKQRERAKGVILIAANLAQVEPWLAPLTGSERARLEASWPGPVTWLVPNRGQASNWVTGDFDTVALRVTDHPVARALCLAFGGPLVSTSANPQGQEPARTRDQVTGYFGDRLQAVAPGQVGSRNQPSEIRDLQTGRIHRPG
ncbi:Sua5/YciO/YrdC/YwlC family protein [Gilvimarinus agarilyticus]|uniref:Sua5/YciO/YrdC/YwlC family protein n=1 Tax=Gilvimarinus agarilyticus TaxID=679259 RepID=UPI00059F3667|nr:Sua5/YciO/YrdC/YwlC family protein [Gilvimarinus agarilyticus]